MTKILFPVLLAAAVLGLLAIPAEACNPGVPASQISYSRSYATYNTCAATTYVAPAAPVYYAFPLAAIVAIPTVTVAPTVVQPTVPSSAPQAAPAPAPAAPQPQPPPQQQEAAALAPLQYTMPPPSVIVQRQFYTNYGIAQAPVINYSYSRALSNEVILRQRRAYDVTVRPAETIVIQRGRAAPARTPVLKQRIAPIRNRIARNRATAANGGVPASQIIIRR